jgi:hypothetical protein
MFSQYLNLSRFHTYTMHVFKLSMMDIFFKTAFFLILLHFQGNF